MALETPPLHYSFPHFSTQLGVFFLGDWLEVLENFPDETFDLLITDPPYGVGSKDKYVTCHSDDLYDVDKFAVKMFRLLKDGSRAFVFSAQKTLFQVVSGFESSGFKLHQILVWHRPNLRAGTSVKMYDYTSVYENILLFHKGKPKKKISRVPWAHNTDILRYPAPQGNYRSDKRYHHHQKPLPLAEHLIVSSTEEGDFIIDPFAGAGTFPLAAEKHGRRWVGVEIIPEFFEISKCRLHNYLLNTNTPCR